jgi:succinate dehydrogenase/fumarate reductase flavoprotein subunit
MKRVLLATAVVMLAAAGWFAWVRFHEQLVQADVLVIGAGISGLSAAYEAGYGGANVAVAEMSSVFGGNAVMSEGGLFIADTPLQRESGFVDSSELAERDMLAWGEDADPEWVRSFVRASRQDIYDWLSKLGVRFSALRQQAGNHVPRFHENPERGLGITRPIYRECLRNGNIRFHWNTRINKLLVADGAVRGATGVNLRTGAPIRFEVQAVVLATGGFQGNERLVRQHWRAGWPQPERLLLGATPNSSGAGLLMGVEAGGATHRLDHQWHYPFGVPDPRFPGENRAVSVRNLNGIWINSQGERFVNEWKASRYTVEAVVKQKPATYWLVFDSAGVDDLRYSGTDWADLKLAKRLLVDNPAITKCGNSWAELARNSGLPADRLEATATRYNHMVAVGEDTDFHRFGRQALEPWLAVFTPPQPRALTMPPFYAMQAFPMTRKNMGGLKIDLDCRVLDKQGNPVGGLFAVGEVAGLGGVNGIAGLEGTYLGPSLVQGRRAGRFIAAMLRRQPVPQSAMPLPPAANHSPGRQANLACQTCHTLPMRWFASRPGYWHFKRAHQVAAERGYDCFRCHGEVELLRPWRHRIDAVAQLSNCDLCHLPARRP